jgi:hypothetical protein
MLHGVAGSLNLTWMLQFKMLQVLLFGVDLSYMFNFCTLTTSSFASVGLEFVFYIHLQNSNIYILKFLHFEIHWDSIISFFHSIGIYCWNLVLESFVEFEFQIQEILNFFILNELKEDKKKK